MILRIIAVCALPFLATQALAGDVNVGKPGSSDHEKSVSDWSVSIGALGFVKPEYEGSNDYDVSGFPLIDIRWRDRVFLNGRDGLGVDVWKDDMFTLSTSVGYSFGRDEDDSSDLNGLGDIDGGATAIVKGAVRLGAVSFSTRLSHQFTGDDTGFLVDLGVGYSWRSRSGWFLRPGLNASFASGDYMDQYFGVSAGQSAASGLAAFDADAGFKSVGAGLLAGYQVDEHWSLTGRLGYDRLIGDAADSPVTKDKDQYSAGLGVSRKF